MTRMLRLWVHSAARSRVSPMTPALLAAYADNEPIAEIRRRFQQRMADSFTSVVEQATGRKVRTFLSESNVEDDVSVEIFLLAGPRTDMGGFEGA